MSDGFKGTWADEEDDTKREPHVWWGLVANNQDPEKRGRVKVTIPGMNFNESGWAEPCGMVGYGGGKHGIWAVPKKGSTVLVGFILGDIDSPYYIPGPAPVGGTSDTADPDNIVFETDDFRFSFIQQEGVKKARLETLLPNIPEDKRDQVRSIIEININEGSSGKSHMVNIFAPSGINIESTGHINIDGASVSIKGRTVTPTDSVI